MLGVEVGTPGVDNNGVWLRTAGLTHTFAIITNLLHAINTAINVIVSQCIVIYADLFVIVAYVF